MSQPMPEISARQQPSYNYDAAIKGRFNSINAIGDQANAYTKQLADRRVQDMQAKASANAAAVNAQQPLGAAGAQAYKGPLDNSKRSQLVKGIAAYQGVDYKWGGADPNGFDCSGLISYVYNKMGVKTPRVSQQQATMGKLTTVNSLKPGDFVAWGNSPATAHHIAVYAGNGMVWESPRAGKQVRLRKINPGDRDIMGIALGI